MNELKCPYCGSGLQHEHITGVYCCKSSFLSCPVGLGTGAFGTKELWEALVDTRKALSVAVDALKMIGSGDIIEHSVVGHEDDNKIFIANKALEQITALEQKE